MVSSLISVFLLLGSLVLPAIAGRPHPHPHRSCVNPKVRKEWRKLSEREKKDWIKAVKCLGKTPHDEKFTPTVAANISMIPPVSKNSSFYDDIVYAHMDLNFDIHFTGWFLPWHRQYIQFFEDSLVEKCGYKGAQPYWDWTIDAHDIEHSDIWDGSPSGIGGWGDKANDYQIYDGGFKDEIRFYPAPHHIRRNFSLFPFTNDVFTEISAATGFVFPLDFMPNTTMTAENVALTVGGFDGDFIGFQAYFEGIPGPHGGAHLMLAGDMGGLCPFGLKAPDCIVGAKWTPNDPVFFLHHAMVDKLWLDWQNRLEMNKYAFAGGSISAFGTHPDFENFPTGKPPFLGFNASIPGDGLWGDVSIWDIIDTKAGDLCYVYA